MWLTQAGSAPPIDLSHLLVEAGPGPAPGTEHLHRAEILSHPHPTHHVYLAPAQVQSDNLAHQLFLRLSAVFIPGFGQLLNS